MQIVYALLCIIGFIAPFSRALPWVAKNGFQPALISQLLFSNPVSASFALDVFVSTAVILVWALHERARGLRLWWPPIIGTLAAGVSVGLPLLLLLRERQRVANLRREAAA